MVWTGTEGANFGVRASGADVTVLLAFVAADGLADVLADGDLVTKNVHMLL